MTLFLRLTSPLPPEIKIADVGVWKYSGQKIIGTKSRWQEHKDKTVHLHATTTRGKEEV